MVRRDVQEMQDRVQEEARCDLERAKKESVWRIRELV
jgi:hypothetical protein